MKRKKTKNVIGSLSVLFLFAVYLNQRFEIIAFHPFIGSSDCDLKVMTWNVHCAVGTDSVRQQRIAELILKEDADFVLLNEFHQDSCWVIDSLLKARYLYTEECQSRGRCGDIFYCKREMSSSGHLSIRQREPFRSMKWPDLPDSIRGKSTQAISATIAIGNDSVRIFGMHMSSNSGDGSAIVNCVDSLKKVDSFYERYLNAQVKRCFQARWTRAFIEESTHPVIVMGDMNDFNCSAPLDILTSVGLKDAWWEGGTGYGCSFHTGWMRLRIDHILYSSSDGLNGLRSLKGLRGSKGLNGSVRNGLKLTSVKVIPTALSDHNPLVACFSLIEKL